MSVFLRISLTIHTSALGAEKYFNLYLNYMKYSIITIIASNITKVSWFFSSHLVAPFNHCFSVQFLIWTITHQFLVIKIVFLGILAFKWFRDSNDCCII